MDNSVRPCDAKSLRAEKSASSDQHRSETDQTVKSGDKLRHRRHRDLTRDDENDNAANDNSADDFDQARNVVRDESGCDRNGHARHAEEVAPTDGRRAGKTTQRQNEKYTRNQISKCNPGWNASDFMHDQRSFLDRKSTRLNSSH